MQSHILNHYAILPSALLSSGARKPVGIQADMGREMQLANNVLIL